LLNIVKPAVQFKRPEENFLVEALRSSLSFPRPPNIAAGPSFFLAEKRESNGSPITVRQKARTDPPKFWWRTFGDDSEGTPPTNLLNSEFDWDYLLRLAETHCVVPLLYCSLTPSPQPSPLGGEGSPPQSATDPLRSLAEVRGKLREAFEENARRNLRLTQELLEILDLLESRGIPAIPFKGPVLAHVLYRNLALRQFVDLDILVPKKNILKAKELLTAKGYSLHYSLTPHQEAVFLDLDCEYLLIHSEHRASVELHWDFAPKYFPLNLDLESLWERTGRVSLSGRDIRVFSKEDLLLLLCVHASKHRWNRLQWICDVAKLLSESTEIRWDFVLDTASRTGCRRILYLGLLLAQEIGGVPLPQEISVGIQTDPKVRILADTVTQSLFLESYSQPGVSWATHWFGIRTRERLRDRLRYALSLLFLPTLVDLKSADLPVFLSFLYYFLRPLRLLFRSFFRVFFASPDPSPLDNKK